MESTELVTVYSVARPLHAEIIQNALEAEGIRAFLQGNTTAESSLAGLSIALIKVQVAAADAERAAEFIAAHEAQHHEELEGDDVDEAYDLEEGAEGEEPKAT